MCAQDRLCFVDGSSAFCGFEAHNVACAALVCPIMLSRKFPPPTRAKDAILPERVWYGIQCIAAMHVLVHTVYVHYQRLRSLMAVS